MARVYATAEDYADYTGDNPDDVTADPLIAPGLRRASIIIETATMAATYDVDGDHMPTLQFVADALRDAVCAQVQWFDETGDITGASAFASVSIGSVGLSGGRPSINGGGTTVGGVPRLAPQAAAELQAAGLTPTVVERP